MSRKLYIGLTVFVLCFGNISVQEILTPVSALTDDDLSSSTENLPSTTSSPLDFQIPTEPKISGINPGSTFPPLVHTTAVEMKSTEDPNTRIHTQPTKIPMIVTYETTKIEKVMTTEPTKNKKNSSNSTEANLIVLFVCYLVTKHYAV